MSTDANSQKHSAQPSEEFLVLAETIADIKSRFERVESEFSTQAKPLEAAGIALNAAVAGLKALQVHVLDQNVANLALKLETTKTAIDEQIGVVVSELKKADDAAIAKTDEAAKALRAELAQIGEQIGKLTTQFGAEIARVSLEAKTHAEKFAAVPGARGADGKAINPTGSYAADKAYSRLDLVSYMGGSYVSNVDGNTEKPGPRAKNWTQVAQRGGGGAGTDFTSISGTCLATQGGTGQTSYAVGDLLYADATTTLAKLTAGASGKYLKSNGAGSAPSWETVSAGDASGPSSATDNAIARFDGTTGKLLQDSVVTIADTTGNLTIPTATASVTLGAATETLTIAATAAGSGTITPKGGQSVSVVAATPTSTPLTGTLIIGNGTAETSVGIGNGIAYFGSNVNIATTVTGASGTLQVGAVGQNLTTSQVKVFNGANAGLMQLRLGYDNGFSWAMGRDNATGDFILQEGTTQKLKLATSSGDALFNGSITTAAPSGGTAGAWRLGIKVDATTTLDTAKYLQVDVGGTLYKVALVTS